MESFYKKSGTCKQVQPIFTFRMDCELAYTHLLGLM